VLPGGLEPAVPSGVISWARVSVSLAVLPPIPTTSGIASGQPYVRRAELALGPGWPGSTPNEPGLRMPSPCTQGDVAVAKYWLWNLSATGSENSVALP
jgi:hypothetical protein